MRATTTHVAFGIARNAAPAFRPRSPLPTIPTLSRGAAIILGFAQQLRQLGEIRRDPPRGAWLISPPISTRLPGDRFPGPLGIAWRTRPVWSQSLNGKRPKVFGSPRRPSVDVLNDDTGGLLRGRVRRHTYAVKFPHEAEANNNPRTEVHAGRFFFRFSNGKGY